MEWIYLIILRYAQCFDKNQLIKGDCNYKSPYIVGYIVDLLRPHFMDCMVRGFQVKSNRIDQGAAVLGKFS